MSSVDIAELQKKLSEHRQQLAQVEAVLQITPNDESFVKLREDLKEVIRITEDLTANAPPKHYEEDKGQAIAWRVGDRCKAKWEEDGKYYVAKIETVSDAQTCLVRYLQYNTTAEVPTSSLQQYTPAPQASLGKDTPVFAVWHEDGLMYPAVVEGQVPGTDKFYVKFAQYKVKSEVAAEDIIEREVRLVEGELRDKIVIPDNLKILTTDSEKVKEQKRRKIKRLKSMHRAKVIDVETKKRKSNWEDFQKGVKRGKTKKSIFASPDTVDGRVGVTGSGKPMTEFKVAPKAARFKPGEEEVVKQIVAEDALERMTESREHY